MKVMNGSRTTIGRLLTTAAVLLAGTTWGCGGSSTPSSPGGPAVAASNSPVATAAPATPKPKSSIEKTASEKPSKHAAPKKSTKPPSSGTETTSSNESAKPTATPTKQRPKTPADLPPAKRLELSRRVAAVMLRFVKLPKAMIYATAGGSAIEYEVPASSACTAQRGAAKTLYERLHQSLSYVKRVTVMVSGRGSTLSAYQGAHCKKVDHLPAAPAAGTVFYSRDGAATYDSSTFRVTSSKWAIDYYYGGGAGSYFVIEVFKNDKLVNHGALVKPGKGSIELEGRGTYRLEIKTQGEWQVRAYGR